MWLLLDMQSLTCDSNKGAFNNYVDQMLPNFAQQFPLLPPHPHWVDKNWHFTYYLPWPHPPKFSWPRSYWMPHLIVKCARNSLWLNVHHHKKVGIVPKFIILISQFFCFYSVPFLKKHVFLIWSLQPLFILCSCATSARL